MIIPSLQQLAVPIGSLVELPGNPRRGDIEAVAASLKAFGQRKPIVVRRHDQCVLAGNHTLKAARTLGWDEIAVVYVDDDDRTGMAYALADNRTAELGGFDVADLAALVAAIDDEALLTASGYDADAVANLLGTESDVPPIDDPDDVPDHVPPISVLGDLWQLGDHFVLCGDSTIITDVERLMAGVRADMVWTDPPYGVAVIGGSRALSPEARKALGGLEIANDDLTLKQLEQLLNDALGNAAMSSRSGASWFVAAPAGPEFLAFGNVLNKLGIWRQTLVWLKSSLVMGRSDYHWRHEAIFYGWKPGAAHTPPPDRKQDTIWQFDRPAKNGEHPTMKPVALIERAIANHTKPNDIILDPFGGSGSTLIAAHQLGRKARLIELDPKYVDVICARFEKATGIQPINTTTGHAQTFLS